MFGMLAALSGLFLAKEYIKEKTTPVIPASYWRNKRLMDLDQLVLHIPQKQFMKNAANGKYYLPDVPPNAKIVDKEQYENDKKRYSFYQVYRFAEKGKYDGTHSMAQKAGESTGAWIRRIGDESRKWNDMIRNNTL